MAAEWQDYICKNLCEARIFAGAVSGCCGGGCRWWTRGVPAHAWPPPGPVQSTLPPPTAGCHPNPTEIRHKFLHWLQQRKTDLGSQWLFVGGKSWYHLRLGHSWDLRLDLSIFDVRCYPGTDETLRKFHLAPKGALLSIFLSEKYPPSVIATVCNKTDALDINDDLWLPPFSN